MMSIRLTSQQKDAIELDELMCMNIFEGKTSEEANICPKNPEKTDIDDED